MNDSNPSDPVSSGLGPTLFGVFVRCFGLSLCFSALFMLMGVLELGSSRFGGDPGDLGPLIVQVFSVAVLGYAFLRHASRIVEYAYEPSLRAE